MDHQFLEQGQALQGGVYQGNLTNKEADDLSKALTAGYPVGAQASGLIGGGVLQMESLEGTLRSVTFEQKNLAFWPAVPTDKAFATVEQYNRVTGFGSDGSPYFAEGGTPGEENSDYVRDSQRIVYFGTKRKVTHQMMLVRTHTGDAVAQQTREGTLWLLKSIERELYWGNGFYSNAGEFDGHMAAIPNYSIAMNGLQQQVLRGGVDLQQQSGDFQGYGIDKSNVKDIHGSTMQSDDVEDGALAIFENFGVANEMHLEPASLSAFSKLFYPKERINNMGVPDGRAGFVLKEFVSSAGTITMKPNVFLRPEQRLNPNRPDNGNTSAAPAIPVAVGWSAVPAPYAATDFVTGEVYKYKVCAENDRGVSAPSVELTAAAAVSGQQYVLTIAATPGAKGYRVYRTRADAASHTEEYIGRVAPVTVGGAATFTDRNRKLPGLGEAYMLTMSQERIVFKQLTPMSKINLAITSAALEWMQILYGALIVFHPRQFFIVRNTGR